MNTWDRIQAFWNSLFVPAREPEPVPILPVRPRVLLITFNPVIRSEGGKKLTQVLGWRDEEELCAGYIDDLRECSKGYVDYQIVERIEADEWPVKEDGFRYDEGSFLGSWRRKGGFHKPDTADYDAIIRDFDLIKRVNARLIDEVWMFGFPYAGFYESRMVGPGAFWCNAPAMPRSDVSRRFVMMGFNYERGVGPMLESFGHRVESIMSHTWRHQTGGRNLWEQFILYDQKAPGRSNCGWMHYAPNSLTDYDWGNTTKVMSNCDDWLNFPNFQGTTRLVDCSDWGNGDMRAHHKWWYERLPNAQGHTWGVLNNWWWYAVDPNNVK